MATYYVSGSENGLIVSSGDTYVILEGGDATDYTVENGGSIIFESGSVGAGGFDIGSSPETTTKLVVSGATANATNLFSGAIQDVDGGTTYGVAVYGGGQVVSGGSAIETTLEYLQGESTGDRVQTILTGGIASSTDVSGGLDVVSGITLAESAQQVVDNGGLAADTVLSGVPSIYGSPTETKGAVIGEAQQFVAAGGVSLNTLIDPYSEEVVASGGVIGGTTTINGGEYGRASLTLNGTAGTGNIYFNANSELIVDGLSMPTNEITQFLDGNDDFIDLTSVSYATVLGFQATSKTFTVETTDGDFSLNILNPYPELYSLGDDGSGGTLIMLCYLATTRILTPTGERLVEDLRIGDAVVTRYSGLQRICWIGRQSYSGRFLSGKKYKAPIRIQAGALGESLPARDLLVSPGHSMLLQTACGEERLVLASTLVNGITITQEEVPDEVHYFQLDLLHHDCIIAEGTWSETYGDGDQLRGQFHNVAEFYQLYPEHREPDELVLCAPRPMSGPKLDQALRPVVLRAMAGMTPGPLSGCIDLIPTPWKVEGWAHDADHPELPVLLEVLLRDESIGTVLACDHRGDLEQAGIGRGHCAFAFSSPVRLPLDAMHEIRVRRLNDGAEIAMSDACHAHIDREFAASPEMSASLMHVRARRSSRV